MECYDTIHIRIPACLYTAIRMYAYTTWSRYSSHVVVYTSYIPGNLVVPQEPTLVGTVEPTRVNSSGRKREE